MAQPENVTVRPAAVAGLFYPQTAEELRTSVVELFRMAGTQAVGPSPKALIVPHAGYVYSGAIAAKAIASLAPDAGVIRRIILLGPTHRVAVRGLAVPSVDAFETPLGRVNVDRIALSAVSDLRQVTTDDRPHAAEHSLEVQLPLLQRVLPQFSIAPFAVGMTDGGAVAEVLDRLWGGPETRIVVSSDLSHYLAYDEARKLDTTTAAAIEGLNGRTITFDQACGRLPIQGLMTCAKSRGLTVERIDLKSSGDTAGPKDRVVGYGAWAFL